MPSVAIYATIKKLERPDEAEGFHKLFYVRIAKDTASEVFGWKKDELGL